MSAVSPPRLMTVEELLDLPDDPNVIRELVRGELRESPMTRRNRKHSKSMVNTIHLLKNWQEETGAQGEVHGGEVGAILKRDPDTAVGIDVAWVPAGVAAQDETETTFIDGPPALAVEILSPSDTQQAVHEKVELYLSCGVSVVWVVDPLFQTVTVHTSGRSPELFAVEQELSGDPVLPGFRCRVSEIFE